MRIQVHRYSEHTYILRQNPPIHWEAPFMYLLMETNRLCCWIQEPLKRKCFSTTTVVNGVLQRWADARSCQSGTDRAATRLDQSQTAALAQFTERAGTSVAALTLKLVLVSSIGVCRSGRARTDSRQHPGLDSSAISLYDPWADLLFTGNAFIRGGW